MITISYAITACTEEIELSTLLHKLVSIIDPGDEIVVVLDEDNTTPEVHAVVEQYRSIPNLFVYEHNLNKDFAQHKNFMNSKCTRHWIFNIDADELPTDELLQSVRELIELNDSTVDVIALPRVNIVHGLTPNHIAQWRWNVDDKNRVNWPDYQLRLYKNTSEIKWQGKVHEKPIGWKSIATIPEELEELSLLHVKDIVRQEQQNNFYENI